MTMSYYALSKDLGTGPIYTYDNMWDSFRMQGCLCNTNYFGSDCSLRLCRTGDDPLTGNGASTAANPTQVNNVQRLTCAAGGGTFTLSFRKQTTRPIAWDSSVADVQASLLSLTTISGVTVVMYGVQACTESGSSMTVEFTQEFGNLPLLVGNSTKLFYSDGSRVPKLLIGVQQVGTKEDEFCSNRGICDPTIGSCTCSVGYTTSNGLARIGTRGDCGFAMANIQSCPGIIKCSGHGLCLENPTYRCACDTGWTGADCSQRTCPADISWFDQPSKDDVAHLYDYVECSGKGICDRSNGICMCEPQFSGTACNRMYCSSTNAFECSGHGACYDMMTLASIGASRNKNPLISYGKDPNNPNTWDATHIYGCLCDPYWFGYDCSLMTCPIGVDPETVMNERQALSCIFDPNSPTDPSKSLVLISFLGNNFTVPATISSDALLGLLKAVPGAGELKMQNQRGSIDSLCSAEGGSFLVEFLTIRISRPLIFISAKSSDPKIPDSLSGLLVSSTEIEKGSWETGECSNRGLCNRANGICRCFSGYDTSDGQGNIGTIADCGFRKKYQVLGT